VDLNISERELAANELPGIDLKLNALGLEPRPGAGRHLGQDTFQNEQIRETEPDISDLYLRVKTSLQSLPDAVGAEEERKKKIEMRAENDCEEEKSPKDSPFVYSYCRIVSRFEHE